MHSKPEVFAVDIGGTRLRVAALRDGRIVQRDECATDAHLGPEQVISKLQGMLEKFYVPDHPIGIACTGKVQSGVVSAVNLATMPGWTNIPLQDQISSAFQTPVAVINDAKAATFAEWSSSAADRAAPFMFVTLSTGIGSGLILNGSLYLPPTEEAGLGFTSGRDGKSLEDTASGTALTKMAEGTGYRDARHLFDAAETGDTEAQQLLEIPLETIALRLKDVHALLGLREIRLGGSVGLRAYTLTSLKQQLPEVNLQWATHGGDAGLYGSALYALECARL